MLIAQHAGTILLDMREPEARAAALAYADELDVHHAAKAAEVRALVERHSPGGA